MRTLTAVVLLTLALGPTAPGAGSERGAIDPPAAEWAPRIAKGLDTQHMHALEGFTGDAGFMPPKGGRVDLSDEEIMGAVDYLVEQAQQ